MSAAALSELSSSLGDDELQTTEIFPDSSFFKERRASALPAPAEIKAINEKSGNIRATSFNRPPPVFLPSLRLVVKYGADVSAVEAQTQGMIRKLLQNVVPVPEIFGWTEYEGQTFIYMNLVEGVTLQDRWATLNETERRSVCKELSHMAHAWRTLKRESNERYIGSVGGEPLNEILLSYRPELAGPYRGANAVQQFQNACGIEIGVDVPIVFTHNDLVPPNILLASGTNPRVAAILDWGQAGWYPSYWEYCKARWVRLDPKNFNDSIQEEWRTEYLPLILRPLDNQTYYYPWLWFVLSKGI